MNIIDEQPYSHLKGLNGRVNGIKWKGNASWEWIIMSVILYLVTLVMSYWSLNNFSI